MQLRKLGFIYSACGTFTKNKERIKKMQKQQMEDVFIKMN